MTSARPADLGEPTTLILVRHGRTADTDQQRARGGDSAGPGLNEPGRQQVRVLARTLAESAADDLGLRPVAVVASPLLRARQTATTVAAALHLQPTFDDGWAELALGDWDGLGYTAMSAGWPEQFRRWQGSTAVAPPNGESLDDVLTRAGAACDRLVAAHPGRSVVVVSHTAPIRAVLARALSAGAAAFWRVRLDPAAVSVIRFWSDGGCEVATVNSAAGAMLSDMVHKSAEGVMVSDSAQLRYRVLTGPDDRTFCERVSAALDEGYELHGPPSLTFNGDQVIVGQALLLSTRPEVLTPPRPLGV